MKNKSLESFRESERLASPLSLSPEWEWEEGAGRKERTVDRQHVAGRMFSNSGPEMGVACLGRKNGSSEYGQRELGRRMK